MTTGTNLQLQYDEATDSWSYQNVDYEYAPASTNSWSGYTSPDPDFKFAPKEEEQQEQEQDNDTVCPPGYIYDETLKQCLPDPEYRAPSYAAEPTGRREDEPEPQNYVDFRNMSYDEMIQFGKNEGYFNAAGTFIGAQESNAFPGIRGLAQFGLDSEANRFAINFAKKGGKVWNPNAPLKGNLYIPKNDDLSKFITNPILWSNYAVNSAKTKAVETVQSIVSNPVLKLQEERLKQEMEKTKQQEIKTQLERDKLANDLDNIIKSKDTERETKETKLRGDLAQDISSQVPSSTFKSGTTLGSSLHGTGSYNKSTTKSKKRQTGPRAGDR